jgi:C4-dicarboxylate transporter DctQ subunit
MAEKYEPKGRLGRFVHEFEETAIALLLGLMTLLTFTAVVLRYVFNSQIIWSLEVILILFSWLVIFYAILMMKGAWDYWAPFAAMDRTSGRWFPTGFESTRDQAWFVTDQVPPMRWLFGWLEPLINQGEVYQKMPRVIPYVILPIGCALILFRVIEAVLGILRGTRASLIVSHEVEDAVEEAARSTDDPYLGAQPPAGRA